MAARYKIPESVLVVIHTADGQVLLIERADRPGFWQSVTGSKDTPDEALIDTARREIAEETGFALDGIDCPGAVLHLPAWALTDWGLENVYEIYPFWQHRYAPGVTRNTERVFGLVLPAALAPQLAPREHTAYVWLPWPEAAHRCYSPSNAEAILQLQYRIIVS